MLIEWVIKFTSKARSISPKLLTAFHPEQYCVDPFALTYTYSIGEANRNLSESHLHCHYQLGSFPSNRQMRELHYFY